MKLLFDQNLSRHLCRQLADLFPHSAHVLELSLETASDTEIWGYAARHGFAIVTKDSDFSERSKLCGAPPKVVWLRCGNATPKKIETLLRTNAVLIFELLDNDKFHCLELY